MLFVHGICWSMEWCFYVMLVGIWCVGACHVLACRVVLHCGVFWWMVCIGVWCVLVCDVCWYVE